MTSADSTHPLGSQERPLRVAIIGSGPSGFYAAESLLRRPGVYAQVDMFDRLPTPYGLVRGGVAPDHQNIKAVIKVYEKVAASPGFRFFGHVKFGQHIQISDIAPYYDHIIYAVGNESDRRLGIPGEDLKGSHSATEFVGWYNSHPDHRQHQFDLSVESVVVVGVGNVAMDVTRILAKSPEALAATDIAPYALAALKTSKVKEIILLGRRGVAQAAFSPAEIQEIAELDSSDLIVAPQEIVLDEVSQKTLLEPNDKKNVAFLTEHVKHGPGAKARQVRLRFLVSPVEIIGENGRVAAVKIEKNELCLDKNGLPRPRGTGQYEILKAGMVLRSVGYRGIPIPGVPFDDAIGHIPNDKGRVLDPANKKPRPGEYVVGWAKRGPTGLIGTNRADSVATVDCMIEDLKNQNPAWAVGKKPEAILAMLAQRRVSWVSFQNWKLLDQIEIEKGKQKGKIREKFSTVEEMLAALNHHKPAGPAVSK